MTPDRDARFWLLAGLLAGATLGASGVAVLSRLDAGRFLPEAPPADPVFLIRSGDFGFGPSATFDFAVHGPAGVRADVVTVEGSAVRRGASADLTRSRSSVVGTEHSPAADPWWGVRFVLNVERSGGRFTASLDGESFDLDRAGSRDPDPPDGYLPNGAEWTGTVRLSATTTTGGWGDGRSSGASSASTGRFPKGLEPRRWNRRLVGRVPEGAAAGLVVQVIRFGDPFPQEPMFAEPPDPRKDRPPPDAFDALNDGTLTPRALAAWNADRLAAGEDPVAAAFVLVRWARPREGEDWVQQDDLGHPPAVREAREANRAARGDR